MERHTRTFRALAVILGLGLAPAISTPGIATADGDAGPLILYMGNGPEQGAQAGMAVANRLGYAEIEISRTEPLMAHVFGDADLWPRSGAIQLCPDDASDVNLIDRIAEAEDALDLLEYSRAINALSPLVDALACLALPLDPSLLSRAAMLLGYARFQAGERDGAREAFAMAAVFHPDVDWDETYPPDAQQVFNSAVLDSLRAQDAHLWPAFGAAEEAQDILVDGGSVPEEGVLRPGLHQLAIKTRSDAPLRMAAEFVPGETIRLAPARELLDAFIAGTGPPEDSAGVGDALVAALARSGDADAYIVEPAFGRIYRFYASSREVREIPGAGSEAVAGNKPTGSTGPQGRVVADPRKKSTKKRANPGPVLVIAGGVTGIVGLSVGLAQRAEILDVIERYQATDDETEREQLRADYQDVANRTRAGYIIAGIGAATAAVGIPVWVVSAKKSGNAYLFLQGGPDGGSISFAGSW